MGLIKWFIGFLVVICVAAFAVLNRHSIDVFYSPVDEAVSLPAYIVILSALAFGFVLGAVTVWLNDGVVRRERRKARRELKVLEKEVVSLKEKRFSPPATDLFPALPVQRSKAS